MKTLVPILVLAALASCDPSDASTNGPGKTTPKTGAPEEIVDVEMLDFGDFQYAERMTLPEKVRRWDGKLIRAVGFMNPGRQVKDVKEFELVMNRDSCCYGTRPRMNHFFQVTLKGTPTVYTSDPVTVVGRFVVNEQWDGDWQLGLYFLEDAKVVK